MKVGIPKEIKNGEFRVSMVPDDAKILIEGGHQVVVESEAGVGSGFLDQDYLDVGANIVFKASEAWATDLVVKVKEPLSQEFGYLSPQLILFTYLHLAGAEVLAKELLKKQVKAIAYETVALENGSLPLLTPMSQVAGRVAMLFAAHLLQKKCMGEIAGKGILLGGISGVPQAEVVIIGGGNVGRHAAQVAVGLGAKVTVFDQNQACLNHLYELFGGKVQTELYNQELLQATLPKCDVLIGAALVVGEHAPQLLSKQMIKSMPQGSLFMDVAIDQGGMSKTSRATSYDEPTYVEQGVTHCCLPNLPASVAQSSTLALTHVTFPYVKMIADKGVEEAVAGDAPLALGVNTWDGELKHAGVKKALASAL
ncbi:MAG: alanine dehydrogenase [Ghiorsea sp.]